MSIVTHRYVLDVSPGRNSLRIRCSMGDTARDIKLLLYDSGGMFSIPSGVSAVVKGTKSNNVGFLHSCIVGDNYVIFTIVEDMSDIPGVVICEIQLTDGNGGIIGTSNFVIQVENPALSDDSDIGDVDTDVITGIITDIETYKSSVNGIVADYKDETDQAITSLIASTASDIAGVNTSMNNAVAMLNSRMDLALQELNRHEVQTVLFDDITNPLAYIDDTATLEADPTTFDYVDFYYKTHVNSSGQGNWDKVFRFEPNSLFPTIVSVQPSDASALNKTLYVHELSFSLSGTVVTVLRSRRWSWDGASNTGANVQQSDAGSGVSPDNMYGGRVYKIVGVNISDIGELTDLRVGTDGTVYQSAGTAVRTQLSALANKSASDISYSNANSGLSATNVQAAIDENTEELTGINGRLTQLNNRFEDGIFPISELSEFRQGGIQTTTGAAIYQQYHYRCVSVDVIEFTADVTLTIADGFRIAYMIFADGEPASFKSWFTGEKTFTAGQTVRIMIARVTEDTTEQADVEEFTSAVTFPYSGDVARRITFVENGMTALASDYTSLSATVEENAANIMNLSPKKEVDGYVYAPFIYPSAFDNDFKPVTVFYDGHEYFTDYKKENFRNSDGTSVIHVSPSGSASASGATEETATTLTHAISLASANSRIVVHDGFYLLSESEYRVTKQLDFIGKGNVYLCFDTTIASPAHDGETGLYTFTSTGTFLKAVVKSDLRIILTKKDTLADCQLSPYSWYAGDGTIYFNLPYSMEVLLLADRSRGLTLQNTGAVGSEMKVYLENINFVGAKDVLYTSQYPGRILYLVLDTVNVLHSLGISIHVNGGKFLAHKSSCMYGVGDGFQYQVGRDSNNNPEPTWFMEIDCVGANLGTQGTQDSINGTTAHDVDKGIRINGKYYNNMGGNCTDIGNTTQTVNLGCMADNSCGNTHKEGFSVQSTLTEMWLYDCYASGNDADLQSQTGCFIYTHNCVFTTRRGNGTVEEISYP